ncbi:hypothetical protein EMIHUDRAFT_462583 [Emiliania huxleyi CCMP1516]|uniref:CS domain-containing protein n=2 Tax=Emiliania huxleyi TaxID=2903 RepID=A0A0D3KF51_EMIH1|nr:hypothetical protein EMIHUDRAFT_462583 [Emiliania huxleyi CCMP1516]EOD34386.1 hypothetical protein EMIHUDRAFT_462583 [Emiliania huxleyi CCMP1516]|eukprot:XP_005786815.1 hypothetical protein EMIHUDRAFT_462583 [Emiliania huxleyi CCMP1516]
MAYTWRQDNATATCGIVVPTGTAHSQLKVVLSRRRLTLELAGSGVLLRRRLFAPVVPRRTRAYTLYVPESGAESTELRLVLFKEKVAGWSSLFCGDGRRQHLQESLAGENAPVCALPEHDGEEREYPLPGSQASCDGCASTVRRFYHCVDCGVGDSAFDLCMRYYGPEHRRTFPHHELAAPITRKPPPQPSPGGAPGNGMLQRRDMLQQRAEPAAKPPSRGGGGGALIKAEVPLEANTTYSWSQTDEEAAAEINLLVRIPPDMARRDIRVEIKPLLLRMVARGHVLLAGSLDKPVVAGEARGHSPAPRTPAPGERHRGSACVAGDVDIRAGRGLRRRAVPGAVHGLVAGGAQDRRHAPQLQPRARDGQRRLGHRARGGDEDDALLVGGREQGRVGAGVGRSASRGDSTRAVSESQGGGGPRRGLSLNCTRERSERAGR